MIRSVKNLDNTSVRSFSPSDLPDAPSLLANTGLARVNNACRSAVISPVIPLRNLSANPRGALPLLASSCAT